MPSYQVHIVLHVSTTIDVEAESVAEARENFGEAPDMPGGLVHGAFGSGASVDEAGEWEAWSVMDSTGATLWDRDERYRPLPATPITVLHEHGLTHHQTRPLVAAGHTTAEAVAELVDAHEAQPRGSVLAALPGMGTLRRIAVRDAVTAWRKANLAGGSR